jgi:hypothetical protein
VDTVHILKIQEELARRTNLQRRCITTRRGEIITSMIPKRYMGSVQHVIGRR